MAEKDNSDREILLDPIWPGLRPLGFLSRSAAYDAVKRGDIPEKAIVRMGKRRTRIKKALTSRAIRPRAAQGKRPAP